MISILGAIILSRLRRKSNFSINKRFVVASLPKFQTKLNEVPFIRVSFREVIRDF